jgi:SulP family sulfate permease
MVIGVTVGVVFASLLFMQRMAKITETHKLVSYEHIAPALNLPNNALVYEIAGPLFFGAAEKAVEAMTAITAETGSVIFVMHAVPTMDMTGLVAFESALKKLTSEKQRRVLLVGLQKQPHELLKKCGLIDLGNKQSQIFVCANLQEAAKFLGQE